MFLTPDSVCIAALEELCDFNDISDDTLCLSPESVHRVEMFMFNFSRIRCLSLFPGLTSLALMQQTFRTIEGLDSCVRLESLCLCENKIERIDGLGTCLRLRELFLHSNQITRIENLEHLTGLETLWLANNRIERIEGLGSLVKLRNLNLARNPICGVGSLLNPNQGLETLNLADTKIGSFKDIAHIARLPKLKELYLSDPHWGQSPVAQLCNYQTYVLFSMGGLRVLDALELFEETKGAAEATYMKKRMYYNMKIKTLQRKTSDGVKLALEGKVAQIGRAQVSVSA
jgi:Leucine-rich repeat (LRR) protein